MFNENNSQIEIVNPISSDLNVLRSSIFSTLMIYLKNNLHLTPFEIKDSRSDYFFATKDNRLFFALWEELPGSKSNNRNTKEPYYIEDLIEKHFEEQL